MRSFRNIALLLALPLFCSAQGHRKTNWEISGFLGGSNYVGDLAPDLALGETKPVVGLGAKYNFNSYIGTGVQLNCGWIAGQDKNFDYLTKRGLSFRSNIVEVAGIAEFNFFRFGTGPRDQLFTPYLYTGISFFKFNPKADYDGEAYFLRNMATEGQGIVEKSPKKYSLFQFAIPIGAGFKWNVADRWNISLHGAYRSTFTDYLDDVSTQYADPAALLNGNGTASMHLGDPTGSGKSGRQRGNPYNKDWYVFAGVSFSNILVGPDCYTF